MSKQDDKEATIAFGDKEATIAFGRNCPPVVRRLSRSLFPNATEISPAEMQDRINRAMETK